MRDSDGEIAYLLVPIAVLAMVGAAIMLSVGLGAEIERAEKQRKKQVVQKKKDSGVQHARNIDANLPLPKKFRVTPGASVRFQGKRRTYGR